MSPTHFNVHFDGGVGKWEGIQVKRINNTTNILLDPSDFVFTEISQSELHN